jgi:hypothetical protein
MKYLHRRGSAAGACTIRQAALAASLAATLLCVGTSPARAQIAFTDVSGSAGVEYRGESYGASWGDLNGDGYLDLFTSNHRVRPSLYLNMRNGTFFDIGPQVLPWRNRQHADTHGATFADYDNDGDMDLVVSTGTGNLSQFLRNENQRLVDRTLGVGLTATNVGGRLPVWLDFNGDKLSDFIMTQYGGIARLFRQEQSGAFTEITGTAKLVCNRFHYAHLIDVTNDGRLDLLCPSEAKFPQKIYDTRGMPWTKLYDSTTPSGLFPMVNQVVDSIVADFDNNGRPDVFLLSGAQLRPSTVAQSSPTHVEAQLTGGIKGLKMVTAGRVRVAIDWNRSDEQGELDLTRILIGANGRRPAGEPFTLDPADSSVVGLPPAPTEQWRYPVLRIGYEPAAKRWTMILQTKATTTSPNVFSEAYLQIDSTDPITNLVSTGLWPSDKASRPTLLMNYSGGWVDQTSAAGLDALIQCVSATAGDFDNDGDIDLYLACRTGATNLPNILYQNQGNGTFVQVPNAGGAAGPTGIAVASGAGTADSVISGDYDVDGFLDLFVTNGFNLRPLRFGGPNKLFRNKGNGNHWIQLDLVGTNSDRDAVGARVFATAAGKTQLRIQDGGYHRWSQDSRRTHFGLAGSNRVDIRVEWPSGTVDTFNSVAANSLYRVVEGGNISKVALGNAPPYQCGPPSISKGDVGVFIWRDCPSGEWRMRTIATGAQITYKGKFTSAANYTKVTPIGLESGEDWISTTNPKQITYSFLTRWANQDGVNFIPQDGASACMQVDAPAGAKVFYGPFRVPMNEPFNLDTRAGCARQ